MFSHLKIAAAGALFLGLAIAATTRAGSATARLNVR